MPGLRDVLIRLRLDTSQYKTAIAAASANTKAFAKQASTDAGQAGKSLGLLRGSYATIGLAAGAAGVAAVHAASDFEQGMANVNATGAASTSQMHDLRDAALEMGRTTTYSATEAAGGMEALLKAGLSANDVIGGGLDGALNLAAAGSLEVGEAAEIAAAAMTQFSLSGKDIPHIADLLAAGAGKAQGEVSDMGQALNQAGLVASGFGLSIEETTGILAEFAAAGLVGSDAGTSLRTMLIRAAAPTAQAGAVMKDYGLAVRDANGHLLNGVQLAGELQKAFKGKSNAERDAALVTIFGQDAIRGANVLYKDGAKGAQEWADKVKDAGYAADVTAKKTDTLKGDLDKLKNSWRALAEGGGAGEGLRPLVQGLDDLADGIGKADRGLGSLSAKLLGANRNDNPWQQLKALLEGDTAAIDKLNAHVDELAKKHPTPLVTLLGAGKTQAELDAINSDADTLGGKHPTPRVDVENVPPSLRHVFAVQTGLDKLDKTNATPTISLDTAEAMGKISRLQRAIDTFRNSGDEVGVGTVLARASGGAIVGPGTATSDSVLLRGSDGEHMLTASDVDKMGGQGAVYAFRRALQSGISGFANGGAVYSQPTRAYAAGGAVSSRSSSVNSHVSISIRDFSFDADRSLASMRVVAYDAANRVLADQAFEAGVA